MTEEIYKPIKLAGYEKTYSISNLGNIKVTATNRQLTQGKKSGYLYVSLKLPTDKKDKKFRVHILVAKTFIPNDDPLKTIVNHKNGDKLDKRVDNLEWITTSGSIKHALETGLLVPFERKVCKYDLDGTFIETYKSVKDAAEKNNIDDAGIVKVCKGNRNTAGGFKWKYFEIFDREKVDGIDINSMKPIEEFPNYKVSSDGKVYSIRYKKFLKTQINEDGYETVQVANMGVKKDFLVHRLVAIAFIPNPDEKLYVNHKNGKKRENYMANLEWATNSENVLHYHNELKGKDS